MTYKFYACASFNNCSACASEVFEIFFYKCDGKTGIKAPYKFKYNIFKLFPSRKISASACTDKLSNLSLLAHESSTEYCGNPNKTNINEKVACAANQSSLDAVCGAVVGTGAGTGSDLPKPPAATCGTVDIDGSGSNPGWTPGNLEKACSGGSTLVKDSMGYSNKDNKWVWMCGGDNFKAVSCSAALHKAVCNNSYTGPMSIQSNGQLSGGCASGYVRSYSKDNQKQKDTWYCGNSASDTNRHFELSLPCSRPVSAVVTQVPSQQAATCGTASGNRTNSLYALATSLNPSVKATDLCGIGSEFVSAPYSFYPAGNQTINVDIGPWDWKCKNNTSGQTIICRSQRTDVQPCSYYSNNNYSKLSEYRPLLNCTSSSQQHCDDVSVRWHLDNKGINDGFCSPAPRSNPTYSNPTY